MINGKLYPTTKRGKIVNLELVIYFYQRKNPRMSEDEPSPIV